ncbi:MAG: hypothetical protein ACQ9MH_27555 [Nitrospinales bacterium]
MDSAKIYNFFSCSFREEDRDVNQFFLSICGALDIDCVNVGTAYSKTPPDKAKEMMNDCSGLIAVCVKRTKTENGKYLMPSAVHDEISFSYGMDLPVLMFVEEGVQIEGFKSNYGTYLNFNRSKLYEPESLKKIVSSLHSFKLELISPYDPIFNQNITSGFYSEYTHSLYELKESKDDYCWFYTTTKKLVFQKPFKGSIRIGTWATIPSIVPKNAEPINWEIKVENSSREIKINTVVEKNTADTLEAFLKFDPYPEENDFVEYSLLSSSKYLNPIWDDEISNRINLSIEDRLYKCYDGIIPIHGTKKAIFEFRFPSSYGLTRYDIVPFVGSYTSKVDYFVESELERATIKIDSFAGNISVRMELESPLLRHLYGIAWNPPQKKEIK